MSCIMKGCPNTKQLCKSLRFFSLPRVPEWRKKWLDVCKIDRKLIKHPLVCEEHFSKDQMYKRDYRVNLRRNAVPTPLADSIDSGSEEFDKIAGSNESLFMDEIKEDTVTTAADKRIEYASSAADVVKTEVILAGETLDYLQNKIQDFSEFRLALDDEYDVSCGEILITLKRVLVFHCSLCKKKYASFAYFLEHLSAYHHYKNVKENVSEFESEAQLLQTRSCDMQSELKQEGVPDDMLQVNELVEIEIKPNLIETEDPLEQIAKLKAENEAHLPLYDSDSKNDEHSFEDKSSDFEAEVENIIQKKNMKKKTSKRTKVSNFKWTLLKGVFPCKVCSEIFDMKRALNRHMLIHSEDEEESFDDVAKDEDYKEDIPIEKKKVKKKEKPKREASERFYKANSVVKEVLKCKECEKKFTSLHLFNRHILTHSGVRQHICKICSYAFKYQSSLKSHMRRHTSDKNISCGMCPKMFFTNPEAREHRRVHTGERPYVCFMCGLAFTTSGALTVHEKKHNDEPLFKCNYCGKGYPAQSQLNYHMVMHTKERPFSCSICSATFPRRKSMLRHIQLLHEKRREEIKIPS